MGSPMRSVRAVILCLFAALALPGCMRSAGPVTVTQPGGELDGIAYGQSYGMTPAPIVVGYAAAPIPVRYDAAYRLDAGDKLRIVVYGPGGLTQTQALRAGGPS